MFKIKALFYVLLICTLLIVSSSVHPVNGEKDDNELFDIEKSSELESSKLTFPEKPSLSTDNDEILEQVPLDQDEEDSRPAESASEQNGNIIDSNLFAEEESSNHLQSDEDGSTIASENPISEKESELEQSDSAVSNEEDRLNENISEELITPKSEEVRSGGVSLLTNMTLDGSYSNQVTLKAVGNGTLQINLLKNRYMIFKIPSTLIPFVDQTSLSGTYNVPSINLSGIEIGRKIGTISGDDFSIDWVNGNVVFNANQLLNVSLLSSSFYEFTLSFKLNALPLGNPQHYTFYGQLTNELIDIELISTGTDTWTLTIDGPVFYLTVPSTLNFGVVPLHKSHLVLNRQTSMAIQISHERALGYDWRLTASATPLTADSGVRLENTIYFKNTDGQMLPLEQGPQLITSGVMDTKPTTLTYPSDEGIVLDLQTQTPRAQPYYSTITWTLVNAP